MTEDESILSRGARAADALVPYGTAPHQDIEIRYGAGTAAQQPLAVILHGGFWRPDIDRSHARPMAQALAQAGWKVALPEYARTPGNPAATLDDVTAILAWAGLQITGHAGPVVVVGHSAGGHLALWATAKRVCPQLSGTLALAPVADLQLADDLGLGNGAVARFVGETAASRDAMDPCRMPQPLSPVTLLHGSEDAVVPLRLSESYVHAHPQARLVRQEGAGHFALIDPLTSAWRTVLAEMTRFVAR